MRTQSKLTHTMKLVSAVNAIYLAQILTRNLTLLAHPK